MPARNSRAMKDYEIQFSGLKDGMHSFDFEVGKTFFEFFKNQNLEITSHNNGFIQVNLELEKRDIMLVLNFSVSGTVEVACDLCMEALKAPISTEHRIIGKFSNEEMWHEDDIIHISSSAFKIDIKYLLYEFISLSLPLKNVHPKGECDSQMIEKLNEFRRVEDEKEEEEKIDPRWDKLKNLK